MYQKFRKLWKKFWEPILGLSFFQWILAGLMALAIWFVYFTCRKKITGWEIFKKYRRRPAVFIFWHGRSMMLSPIVCLGGMRAYAVASRHKDGRMMGFCAVVIIRCVCRLMGRVGHLCGCKMGRYISQK